MAKIKLWKFVKYLKLPTQIYKGSNVYLPNYLNKLSKENNMVIFKANAILVTNKIFEQILQVTFT